jgi:hypothetical protein
MEKEIEKIEQLCDELGITVEEYFLQCHRAEEIEKINQENRYLRYEKEKEKYEETQRILDEINYWI